MLQPIHSFAHASQQMSKEEFLLLHPDSVLVLAPVNALGDTGFATSLGDGETGGLITVALIRKRAGANAFDSMVTIGRAPNNDITLATPSVSKFHAYVTTDKETAVVDAGSKFGTFVGEVKLEPQQRVVLGCGDALRFGNLSATYYSPAGFFECLREASSYGPGGVTG